MSWSIPIKTDWMREQSSHEPSMQYARDIFEVCLKLHRGFTALEIGMAWGFSTLAILEAGAGSLLSVDPNVLAKGHEEAEANGYDNHAWTCCKSEKYWRENTNKFDLIYVDGSHKYEAVVEDLYEAWARVKPMGLLMVDDWEHKKNQAVDEDGTVKYGVSLACFEFWKDHLGEIKDVGIEGRVLWFSKRLSPR